MKLKENTDVEQCCGGRRCPLEDNPMKWSILICTIREREKQFLELTAEMMAQIAANSLQDHVEVIYLLDSLYDKNKKSIGQKRNELIEAANGDYVSFIDDDDKVSPDYVKSIYERLQSNPDVVGITGVITTNGKKARVFIHSIKYDEYFEKEKIYYRPPNHLNPMKKELIKKRFPEKSHGEDTDWAMSMVGSFLYEEMIEQPVYFYKYQVKPIYK
jgi:glycosyltransferase involved in cell wall biosynthesis